MLEREAARVSPFYQWSAAYTHRSFLFVLRFNIVGFNPIPLSALIAFHLEAWHVTHLTVSWRYSP